MGGRRSTRGILTTMAKAPRGKKAVPQTLLQRIGFWLGATAIAAVGVVIVAAFVTQLLRPPVSVFEQEADAAVIEITGPPPGSPPETLAGAIVELQRQRVTIPLTLGEREGLAAGTVLHVKYKWVPSLGAVHVHSWDRKR